MGIFYRPSRGVAADFIPWFWKGKYHLFFIHDDRRAQPDRPMPWRHLVTRDFVRFEDWDVAVAAGGPDAPDRRVYTGSVLRHGKQFHIFYTGHNDRMRAINGGRTEVVLHATSTDLRHWTKDHAFRLAATDEYEPHDWRDPLVYRDPISKQFSMLLTARRRGAAPSRHRGCLVRLRSDDLLIWGKPEPFWTPDLYYTHECPDLFRMGDWWYLLYSTFSERRVTHYRMAKSPRGPWVMPDSPDGGDSFDCCNFYAAKTASDGKRRFLFGWMPTRAGDSDAGAWEWGGELVVHQIRQRRDGTLTVSPPRSVLGALRSRQALTPLPVLGRWTIHRSALAADARQRHSLILLGELPDEARIETTIRFSSQTSACGVILRCDSAAEKYYSIRLEPQRRRVVFDRWPRAGDQAFMYERPVELRAGEPVRVRILVSGTCCVAYVNDCVAMSSRMYDHRAGNWGVFVTEGQATFSQTTMRARGTVRPRRRQRLP